MKKIIWTPKERQAIEDSLTHWIEDIVMVLMIPGIRITEDVVFQHVFQYEGERLDEVPMYDINCPLCKTSSFFCPICPYLKYYDKRCYTLNGSWGKFEADPTLENAINMAADLEEMLLQRGRE